MVTLLAKLYIKEQEDAGKQREAYGMLCGIVGILLNVLLFAGKFLAGYFSNSIAITADAVNNLSDAGSSVVTLLGFKLAGQKPDKEHPFGHGRVEYVSGLIVAAAIILMAYELISDSVNKILHPEETSFSLLIVGILLASIAVKLYMSYYNRSIGKKINSAAMQATATDSLSDSLATTVVLISAIVGHFSGFQIDGYCGVLVGLLIAYAGYSAAKDTLSPLLGKIPDEAYVKRIEDIVMAHEEVCGIHDMIVHDYGPGRQMISLHAEVPAEANFLEIHDVIDTIEAELRYTLGCDATIHMDPIVTGDAHVEELKQQVIAVVSGIDEVLSIHDFRVVMGPTHTNLIFDVLAPHKFRLKEEDLYQEIQKRVTEEIGETYFVAMKVDRPYVS